MVDLIAQNWTTLAVVAILGGGILHDIFLATDSTEGNTYSAVYHRYARKYPFLIGITFYVLGHLTWPIQDGLMTVDECYDFVEAYPPESVSEEASSSTSPRASKSSTNSSPELNSRAR